MTALHEYAKELKQDLPVEAYRPVRSRLLWLPVHLSIIGAAATAILFGDFGVVSKILMSLVIGHSYACLAFLAHEILHGTVVRSRTLQTWLGGLCLLPHCLPPNVWRTWHNRFHHGYTGVKGKDPDGFGDPVLYRRSRLLHTIITFLPGSGYIRSAFYFLFYFSFHVLFVLFIHSRKYEYWKKQKRQKQIRLFMMQVLFWVVIAAIVGPIEFVFIHLIPLMVANTIQMTYVTTNHWLCDETHDHNDPLRNSLSVKLPRFIDWLHLNASYHTEHHLGPTINPQHAPLIHQSMRSRYGDQCRRLSLLQIMVMTYKTPRVHLSDKELVNLDTGKVYSTLGPKGEPPTLVDQVQVPVRRRRTKSKSENEPAETASSPGIPPVETTTNTDDGPATILPFPKPASLPSSPGQRHRKAA